MSEVYHDPKSEGNIFRELPGHLARTPIREIREVQTMDRSSLGVEISVQMSFICFVPWSGLIRL